MRIDLTGDVLKEKWRGFAVNHLCGRWKCYNFVASYVSENNVKS